MPKLNHAPGPWKALQHNWSDTSIYAENKLIARLTIYDEASEDTQEALEAEMSAHAKLIAAAPRMYEALQKLARLGNEPHYGNSIGNQIARDALKGLED